MTGVVIRLMFQHEFTYSSGLLFSLKHYVIGSIRGNGISIHVKTISHLSLPYVVIAMEMRFRRAQHLITSSRVSQESCVMFGN